MARKPTKPTAEAQSLDHQTIASDLAAFRKRGGRIEVLGNTPLRSQASTTFRSKAEERKPPTPVKRRAAG
jgi:hypothetical protein